MYYTYYYLLLIVNTTYAYEKKQPINTTIHIEVLLVLLKHWVFIRLRYYLAHSINTMNYYILVEIWWIIIF